MTNNISLLDVSELQKLKTEVAAELDRRETARREEAFMAAQATAEKYGYQLSELLKEFGAKKRRAKPKYQDPSNPRRTWNGIGRQPGWVVALLAEGKALDDIAIK